MSSETSTKPGQVFILLSMAAATAAVMLTGQTHPVALLLLSAGVLACGLAGYFMHTALASLVAPKGKVSALSSDRRELLVWDKQRVLHSIKELEFDHRMGKVNAKDFQTLAAPLRVHAAALMEDLDRLDAEAAQAAQAAQPVVSDECPKCGTANDADARFCKSCGTKINGGSAATKIGTGIGAILLVAALGAAWPATASAQIAMPDPKTVSGMPIPAAEVPAGGIQVRVIRGSWDKNIANQPVQFLIGGKTRTVKTNDQGRAEVSGLAPGTVVTVSTVVDKETLTSQAITVDTQGVRVALVATDPEAAAREEADKKLAAGPPIKGTVTLGPNTRIVVEPGDEVLTVYYVLDILNAEKAPVDLGGPLQLDLPSGARGGGIMDGSWPQGKLLGAHLTVVGPFKPGSTEVQLGFELPTGSATKTIAQMFPVAVPETTVVLQKAGIEDLVSPQLTDRNETTNQGQLIVVARGTALGPGGTLSFDVTGLPHHPRWPRYLALTLAMGFLVVGLREGFRRA
jgi:hypothetical protein